MKIFNTILALFQLMNEISAKAAYNFKANLDYLFLRLWFGLKTKLDA